MFSSKRLKLLGACACLRYLMQDLSLSLPWKLRNITISMNKLKDLKLILIQSCLYYGKLSNQ